MKAARIIGLGAVIALISSAALAFQEQPGGAVPVPAAPTAAAPTDKGLPVAPAEAAPAPNSGTEIRIPGLGRLGVLPKMDFGLELLYGANDPKPRQDAPRDNSEDLTIRGSIKHRF